VNVKDAKRIVRETIATADDSMANRELASQCESAVARELKAGAGFLAAVREITIPVEMNRAGRWPY
jgi:hypothetical protein